MLVFEITKVNYRTVEDAKKMSYLPKTSHYNDMITAFSIGKGIPEAQNHVTVGSTSARYMMEESRIHDPKVPCSVILSGEYPFSSVFCMCEQF